MFENILCTLKKIKTTKAMAIILSAVMMLVAVPTTVKAEGYWTDGYWDGTNNVWVDGYWTETGSGYTQSSYTDADYNTVKVGNYKANLMYGSDQYIVDLPNTAAFFYYGGRPFIADHAYQGFNAIRWNNTAVVNGQTYHLVSRYYATWGDAAQGRTLYLPNGEEMWYCWDGSLVMYTCSGSGAVVTYWN